MCNKIRFHFFLQGDPADLLLLEASNLAESFEIAIHALIVQCIDDSYLQDIYRDQRKLLFMCFIVLYSLTVLVGKVTSTKY